MQAVQVLDVIDPLSASNIMYFGDIGDLRFFKILIFRSFLAVKQNSFENSEGEGVNRKRIGS